MIIIKSQVELLLKIETWKSGVEKKGPGMNIKKDKKSCLDIHSSYQQMNK